MTKRNQEIKVLHNIQLDLINLNIYSNDPKKKHQATNMYRSVIKILSKIDK